MSMQLRDQNIDIFCEVIDNFGDAGFSFRLARALKQHNRSRRIRLFIDDIYTLKAIAPEIDIHSVSQILTGIEIVCMDSYLNGQVQQLTFAPLIIESLACEIPDLFRTQVYEQAQLIIVIEHLTAERSFESMHGLAAPTGFETPRYVFAQGVTSRSGGMLIEDTIIDIINQHTDQSEWRKKWLEPFRSQLPTDALDFKMGSLFSYNRSMDNLVDALHALNENNLMFVLGNLSQASIKQALENRNVDWISAGVARLGQAYFLFPEMLHYNDYDSLLFSMDYNFVRGEDSLARAILAGKPFVWHSYEQEDNYQLVKVVALLDVMEAYQDCASKVFEQYRQLLMLYNSKKIENNLYNLCEYYYSFFHDFVKIQSWVNRFRQDLILHGGIVPNLDRFIKSL